MSHERQDHWDTRYAEADPPPPAPLLLQELAHLLPRQGQALDLACGLGGASLFLARRGLRVDALDLSPIALNRLQQWADAEQLDICTRACDLEAVRLPQARYALIVVSRFLQRDLFTALIASLQPGGLLCYETFTALKARPGGPRNPDYLLQPGELLRLTQGLNPVYYREEGVIGDTALGVRNLAQLIAQKPQD